jgi:hypothetical protein
MIAHERTNLRAFLLAAGAATLISIGVATAPAAADCGYTPSSGYYFTDGNGNDPTVYENYNCYVFYMSRGNLNPSYQDWRGWLLQPNGGWYTNGFHYDNIVGEGVELEPNVAATTNEHAQTDGGSGWRNEEYH